MKKINFKRFYDWYQRYISKSYFYLIILILVIILGVGFSNIGPYIFGRIIDCINTGNINIIKRFITIYFCIFFVTLILNYIERYIANLILVSSSNILKEEIFMKILTMKCINLDKYTKGEMISRLESDVSNIINFYIDIITNIILIIFNLVISIYFIFKISKTLSIISIFIFPATYMVNLIFRKKFRFIKKLQMDFGDSYKSFLNEIFYNINGIRAFQLENKFKTAFGDYLNRNLNISKKDVKLNANITLLKGIINNIFDLLIIYIAAVLIINAQLTIGSLVAFNTYISRLFDSISIIMNINMNINTVLINMDRIDEIRNESSESTQKSLNNLFILDSIYSIQFFKLKFAYSKDIILNDISFGINSPGLYALVGENGCGKSTLFKLLLKFYNCNKDCLLINNIDINNINTYTLRNQITYIAKESFILNDTIENNLKLGNITATQQEIEKACKKADIHEYILTLEKGYKTIVGENGNFLSSGQKQKLNFARALLRKSSVILLDEITSDLDGKAEQSIIKVMKEISKETIVIFISHKISTVMQSDNVILINKGKIDCISHHKDLINENTLYCELFKMN